MVIVGVDEVGRGALAGPVVAAAVILDNRKPIESLSDSKKLSSEKRILLYNRIINSSLCYQITEISSRGIDQTNILRATLLAMCRAVDNIKIKFDQVLVDGNQLPKWKFLSRAIIKGDSKIPEISAASILAKVYRDNHMIKYGRTYPNYCFDQHKGYPTRLHIEMLSKYGPLSIHRKTFRPVRSY